MQNIVRDLVDNGQLEFIGGGAKAIDKIEVSRGGL